MHAVSRDSSVFKTDVLYATAKYLCAKMDRRRLLPVYFMMTSHSG